MARTVVGDTSENTPPPLSVRACNKPHHRKRNTQRASAFTPAPAVADKIYDRRVCNACASVAVSIVYRLPWQP